MMDYQRQLPEDYSLLTSNDSSTMHTAIREAGKMKAFMKSAVPLLGAGVQRPSINEGK